MRTVGFIALCVFCLGMGSGWLGARYSYTVLPEKKAKEEAGKQQKELDKMVRRGRIASVEPDVLTVKVEKGSGDDPSTGWKAEKFDGKYEDSTCDNNRKDLGIGLSEAPPELPQPRYWSYNLYYPPQKTVTVPVYRKEKHYVW